MRACPTGAIHEVLPWERFAAEEIARPERVGRSLCPYCGVGCQVDLHVRDNTIVRVTSPWIEEDTPNDGSLCVKGRFGYDFPQHRDRLKAPLIRVGWVRRDGRWLYDEPADAARRRGPWLTTAEEAQSAPSGMITTGPHFLGSWSIAASSFPSSRSRMSSPTTRHCH